MNYDETDDEEDVNLKAQGTPPSSSAVLPVDEGDEIDLCSDELAEILADGPHYTGDEAQGGREGSCGDGRVGWRRWWRV